MKKTMSILGAGLVGITMTLSGCSSGGPNCSHLQEQWEQGVGDFYQADGHMDPSTRSKLGKCGIDAPPTERGAAIQQDNPTFN